MREINETGIEKTAMTMLPNVDNKFHKIYSMYKFSDIISHHKIPGFIYIQKLIQKNILDYIIYNCTKLSVTY